MTTRSTTAYATNLVISSNPARLHKIIGYNSGTAKFLQIHNAASLPADTAVPEVVIAIAATSNFEIDFGDIGRKFSTGIVVCNSTTGPTKTISGAELWIDANISPVDGSSTGA